MQNRFHERFRQCFDISLSGSVMKYNFDISSVSYLRSCMSNDVMFLLSKKLYNVIPDCREHTSLCCELRPFVHSF